MAMEPSKEIIRNSSGRPCTLHIWQPELKVKGVCAIFHGYTAHSLYPSTRYLAELLVAEGIAVLGIDFDGHGASQGRPGLIWNRRELTADGVVVFEEARKRFPDVPVFLAGTSMGGAVALNVSRQPQVQHGLAGVLLLSPMVKILEAPPAWQVRMLRGLSYLIPWAKVGPPKEFTQYKDPDRRSACEKDAFVYRKKVRVATAAAMLQTSVELQANLHEVKDPFFVLFGSDDGVTDPKGAEDLMLQSKTLAADKEYKSYPGGLHGLLMEPLPLRGEIERDISTWLQKRLENYQAKIKYCAGVKARAIASVVQSPGEKQLF